MADLLRMLENNTRQTRQLEDKINAAKQQEELLLKELEGARVLNVERRSDLAGAQAKHGEVASEVQQKAGSITEVQAANERSKQDISTMQQQRQQLWDALQAAREEFIACCAAMDSEACSLLEQLRSLRGGTGPHTGQLNGQQMNGQQAFGPDDDVTRMAVPAVVAAAASGGWGEAGGPWEQVCGGGGGERQVEEEEQGEGLHSHLLVGGGGQQGDAAAGAEVQVAGGQ